MTPQGKAKQQAEVMLAYANGAEIEYYSTMCTWLLDIDPNWNWDYWEYRVKKPAPKVVKLEAYISPTNCLCHFVQGKDLKGYKRVPSLDLEYVEDAS